MDHIHLPRQLVLSASEGQRSKGITLGRLATSRLQLDSLLRPGMVSREHCRFRYDAATRVWTVEDLSSENGTAINNKRLVPTEAKSHTFILPTILPVHVTPHFPICHRNEFVPFPAAAESSSE